MRLPRLKRISGKVCVKILCNQFGFYIARQKGSHIMLRKETTNKTIRTVVPDHKELKLGTLKGILESAGIDEEEFLRFQ